MSLNFYTRYGSPHNYSRVTVFRGAILPYDSYYQTVKTQNNDYHYQSAQDFYNTYSFQIHAAICDILELDEDDHICITHISKKCGNNPSDYLVGFPVSQYLRASFVRSDIEPKNISKVEEILASKKKYYNGEDIDRTQPLKEDHFYYFCGKLVEIEGDDGISFYCGEDDRMCLKCTGMTVNGSYDVEKMNLETVECNTYCYKCNHDSNVNAKLGIDNPCGIRQLVRMKTKKKTLFLKSHFGKHIYQKLLYYIVKDNLHFHVSDYERNYCMTLDKMIPHVLKRKIEYYTAIFPRLSIRDYYVLDGCSGCDECRGVPYV